MSKPINEDKKNNNVITDKADGSGFEVDWDTIEKNYSHYHRRRRHHRHSSHSKSSSQADEKNASTSKRKDKPSKKSEKKKWSLKKKIIIGILLFFLCIILGTVGGFFILRYMGMKSMLNYDNIHINVPDGIDYRNNGNIIYYNGHTYEFNNNIASILFMGIDNTEINDDKENRTTGRADALYLFTYDTSNGKIKVLCLNRDTITDISRYDVSGRYYDTQSTQLCLAYSYGDGAQLSADNQVTAVERLLFNVPINSYFAIDLSAIKLLNDDIGGVTLTPAYTFGSFTKGVSVTLKGDMAEEFVRTRDVSLLDDNLRRMDCQRLYINSFAAQASASIRNDISVPFNMYSHVSEYTVTNFNLSKLTFFAFSLATNYSGMEMITTDGQYTMVPGDVSAHYNVDKDKLFETVLDIFYTRVD